MRVLYIINGLGFASNVSLGGSDKRALEIGKRLSKKGCYVSVLTTEVTKKLLIADLQAEYHVVKQPWFLRGRISNRLLGRVLAYFYLTLAGCCYSFKDKYDVVFPTSDFFFDIFPAIFCKLRGVSSKVVFIVHHVISSPFRRKGGALNNFLIYLSQRMSFLAMGIFSEVVFVYATREGDKIKDILRKFGVKGCKMYSVVCGIDLGKMRSYLGREKKFDACFVGGLRPAKGLYDLIPIWKKVCSDLPGSKLIIMGSGLSTYVNELKDEIKKSGLEQDIVLHSGHLDEKKLYDNLSSAKLLILPSYEEGWSIIVCEAFSLGIPAVVYDLEVFDIFGEALSKAKTGDINDFSGKVVHFLKDQGFYNHAKESAIEIIKKFDWDEAARIEGEILEGIV